MNKTVDIRRFYKEDAPALEDVIRKTWKYDAFCSSETAARLAHVYLYSCLANQTFTAVAIVDGKPCGIIMAKHIQKHRCPFSLKLQSLLAIVRLLITREGREICSFYGKIRNVDQVLLDGSGKTYGGELSFFVLDEAVRGLGIGKQLYAAVLTYMRQENIQSFYLLYTDSSCNYGFYEHRGMQRRGETEMVVKLAGQQAPMKFFLYDITC